MENFVEVAAKAKARSTTDFFVQPVLRLSALRFLIAGGENSKLFSVRFGFGEDVLLMCFVLYMRHAKLAIEIFTVCYCIP